MPSYSHLSFDERHKIQFALDVSTSFKQIAKQLNRDCTTIAKEVRFRRVFRQAGSFTGPFNDCALFWDCKVNGLCENSSCRKPHCKTCNNPPCRKLCKLYKKAICPKREKPPYICNGCEDKKRCSKEKALYQARTAQKEYETLLHESRSGICASQEEIARLNALISPLLDRGQSIHHITANSAGQIMWSDKTIYKYVDLSLFQSRNIDMLRQVRYRPRKSKHESFKVDKTCRIGRTYDDFKNFVVENPDRHIVEMDTVHGSIAGKCLLTLHFVAAHFMLAYLLDACTAQAVNNVFCYLRNCLGRDLFAILFPILLGDNGPEFSNPQGIELDEDGSKLCHVFYCDPMQPQQKGALENNHEMIRRIIPKGKAMDLYTQKDISLMMNHINSYSRKALNDRTPFAAFEFLYGQTATKKLGVNLVAADLITLRPTLLNRG